jgi:hemerythrin-like metal-binding protein
LEHLQRYLRFHFDTEEQVLAAESFPALEEHAREHAQLEQQISDYMAHARVTGKIDLREIARVLGDWVHHHMTGSDQQWAQELFAP